MTAMADSRLRVQYPELKEFFEWKGWPAAMPLHWRWRVGEIVWILKEGGPIEHKGNATGALRDKAAAMDSVGGLIGMTGQHWSNILGEMAGIAPSAVRKFQWRPALILRKMDGTRTKRLEVNPAASLPPNPLPLYAAHLEKVRAAEAVRAANQAPPVPEPEPVVATGDPRPEPGADKAKLDVLLGRAPVANGFPEKPKPDPAPAPEPAPTPAPDEKAPTMLAPRPPQLFENDAHTIVVPRERAQLDVDEVVADSTGASLGAFLGETPDPEPFLVEPRTGLADELARVGNRSLVDNARMLLSLASDMLTQAFMAEATAAAAMSSSDDKALERLSIALEEAGRLRKKLQTSETVKNQAEALARRTEAALRAERERADILEGNVARLLKGEKAENSAAIRAGQKFIAEKPRTPAGV